MKHFFITALFATFFSCGSQLYPSQSTAGNPILCGAAQTEEYMDLLKNKRVGLIANQTSTIGHTHLADTLVALGIQVATVFAPEHGFRGEAGAGEHIKDGKDPKTGIPVLSLYGKTKKPTAEMLKGIDLLVFDIQDVGARFYTYISTLHYVLEAAAENNIEVLVLDRPNPNGYYVDGPVREEKYASFVGMHAIPIVHGLTVGELTRMIMGEGWLKSNPVVHIIPCKNYTHSMRYSLPVKPSPNLPNDRAIELYPSLCWFEGTEVSVGRGTPYPFQIIGFPDCTTGTYTFTPIDMPGIANDPPHENKLCKGLDLRTNVITSGDTTTGIQIDWLLNMYSSYPNPSTFFFANGFFDKLCGTASVREMVISGKTSKQIRESWQEDLVAYKKRRKLYLLYPDFE